MSFRVRHDRQLRITGWEQDKIAQLRVGVIGGDFNAFYTLLPLVSMGVGEKGEIRILAREIRKTKLLDWRVNIGSDLIALLSKVSPYMSQSLRYYKIDLVQENLDFFLRGLDVIIDTTNDPQSKAIATRFAIKNNIKIISFSTVPCYGRIKIIWHPQNAELDLLSLMPEFQGMQQDLIMSMLFGGLAVNEFTNYAVSKKQKNIELVYHLLSQDRLSMPDITDISRFKLKYKIKDPSNYVDFSPFKVVMIGAGALGNPVAIALAHIRVGELVIIDPDTVEETNLNRQYCYYDCINRYKAEALAEKVKIMSGGETNAIGVVDKFTLKEALNGKFSRYFKDAHLILALVDNFEARADAADLAEKLEIPLISAGTSPFEGHIAFYIPGKSRNLNIIMKYRENAKKTDPIRCAEVHEPSVVTSNQIIGSLVALESLKFLKPDIYGEPLTRAITFYSYFGKRFEI